MAILETTVTIIGCFILGIDINNPIMFILSCYFVSRVFMTFVYSLVSLFDLVGKGVAIVLLVFQISGTGGVYAIELMNKIFGMMYPYLPMTYGINLVRESELGLLWSNYIPAFLILLAFGVVTIIISVLLKQRFDRRTKFFQDKLSEVDIFSE